MFEQLEAEITEELFAELPAEPDIAMSIVQRREGWKGLLDQLRYWKPDSVHREEFNEGKEADDA